MNKNQTLRIELLMFEDCPNTPIARDRIMKAMYAEGVAAEVETVDVSTVELANELHFLGSPSIRVNAKDVEVGAGLRTSYGLMCRTYEVNGRMEGAPSIDQIRSAIRAAVPPHEHENA